MNKHLPNYDDRLGFRRISAEDWLQPDIPAYFPGTKHQQWIELFTARILSSHVPAEIVRMNEVARGAIIYGWFFYPLLALGVEQAFRVLETAVKLRCEMAGKKPKTFHDGIKALVQIGAIPAQDEGRWHAVRSLRNSSSHPSRQSIWDPGMAADTFTTYMDCIDQVFLSGSPAVE
jgi:hypothetical protein